jgi:predicted nucleic acid-binding protein
MGLILFDTNIFIDMLNDVDQATIELSQYSKPAISIMTYMELRAGERGRDKEILDAVLGEFEIIEINQRVTDAAIALRKRSISHPPKVKLPDAIIGATAKVNGIPLVTRNPIDFVGHGITVHVPYDYDSKTGTVSNVRAPITTSPSRPKVFFSMSRIEALNYRRLKHFSKMQEGIYHPLFGEEKDE